MVDMWMLHACNPKTNELLGKKVVWVCIVPLVLGYVMIWLFPTETCVHNVELLPSEFHNMTHSHCVQCNNSVVDWETSLFQTYHILNVSCSNKGRWTNGAITWWRTIVLSVITLYIVDWEAPLFWMDHICSECTVPQHTVVCKETMLYLDISSR